MELYIEPTKKHCFADPPPGFGLVFFFFFFCSCLVRFVSPSMTESNSLHRVGPPFWGALGLSLGLVLFPAGF